MIRVMTVDDHPLMRAGISSAVNSQPDMEVIAEACNGAEAIELFRTHQPQVTLVDLRMPEKSGIDVIAAIRSEFPQARLIVLTTYDGDVQALRALRAGAAGYLLKSMLRHELADTIRAVHAGQRRIPRQIAHALAEHSTDDALSTREIDVLRSVSAGNSNKAVASELALSQHTVKGHLKSILSKLNATDRTHAVMIALKRGIIDL